MQKNLHKNMQFNFNYKYIYLSINKINYFFTIIITK